MLKHLDPLLNADVLHALRSMGHGDDLIICDTNFPADSVARETRYGKLLRIDGDAARVTKAVLSQFPLDTFVDHPALRMEVVGEPQTLLQVHKSIRPRAKNSSWALLSASHFMSAPSKLIASSNPLSAGFMAALFLKWAWCPLM
jgi:L-fucose mutarotase